MSKSDGMKIAVKFSSPILDPQTPAPDMNVNVALGKTYTSNGVINYRGFSITNDDTNSANYIEVPGTDMYVQIDLGEEIEVSAVRVWHYYTDSRIYKKTKTEVSLDGIEWTAIFDYAVSGTYVETSSGKLHMVEPITKIRYVRDWLNGSDKNTGNHWVEIKVYGAQYIYNKDAFSITGQEREFVGGSLIPGDYQIGSAGKEDDISLNVDLSVGTFTNVEFVEGALKLKKEE